MSTGFFTDTTLCIGCKACEVACKQWNQLPADGYAMTGMSYDNTVSLSATSWRHVAFIEQLDGRRKLPMAPLPPSHPFPAAAAPPPIGNNGQGDQEDHDHEVSNSRSGGIGSGPLSLLNIDGKASYQVGFPDAGRWLMMSDVCKHCTNAGCLQACPTGAIIRNEFDNVYIQPDICNGCGYCVPACPFGVVALEPQDGRAFKCTLCYDRQKEGIEPACAKACPTDSIVFGELDELKMQARQRVADLHTIGETRAYLYGVDEETSVGDLNAFFLLVDEPEAYGLPQKPFLPQDRVGRGYLASALTALVLAGSAAISIWRGRGREE